MYKIQNIAHHYLLIASVAEWIRPSTVLYVCSSELLVAGSIPTRDRIFSCSFVLEYFGILYNHNTVLYY